MENKNQVFFLHFAGGSSSSYNFLSKFIRNAEVHQLELPGRGNRFAEPFVPDIEAAIEDYTRQIINRLNNRSFAVFGHSMGALIAIHVIKRLERLHHFSKRLIVSGNSGPGIKHEHSQKRYLMDTDDFLSELRKIGGMPAAFFQHQGLINHFSPIIKSDFKIIEEQEKTILGPVNTPIFAIIGNREKEVKKIFNWRKFTNADFQYKVFEGGHFFIHEHKAEVAELINESFAES